MKVDAKLELHPTEGCDLVVGGFERATAVLYVGMLDRYSLEVLPYHRYEIGSLLNLDSSSGCRGQNGALGN